MHLENLQSQIQWLRRRLRFGDECCSGGMVSLYQQADAGELWNNLLEQLQPPNDKSGQSSDPRRIRVAAIRAEIPSCWELVQTPM
jgi:hypothetical protein